MIKIERVAQLEERPVSVMRVIQTQGLFTSENGDHPHLPGDLDVICDVQQKVLEQSSFRSGFNYMVLKM